jgi:hypothetical protein
MVLLEFPTRTGCRDQPKEVSDSEGSHGRQVRWLHRSRNDTGAIRERWTGAILIIELVSNGRRDGKPFCHLHYFITTLRTSPKALLRLVRQRWAITNHWHWPRDTQLGEDAHRYTQKSGVQVLALLTHLGSQPAAEQWLSLNPRWPDGRGARHQPHDRLDSASALPKRDGSAFRQP